MYAAAIITLPPTTTSPMSPGARLLLPTSSLTGHWPSGRPLVAVPGDDKALLPGTNRGAAMSDSVPAVESTPGAAGDTGDSCGSSPSCLFLLWADTWEHVVTLQGYDAGGLPGRGPAQRGEGGGENQAGLASI